MPALINTVIMTGLSLLIAVPLGIFCGDLSGGIRQTRQQIRGSDPADNGDAVTGSRPSCTAAASECRSSSPRCGWGLFPAGRCVHPVDHGAAADHAGSVPRKSLRLGSGFLPGGKFRAGVAGKLRTVFRIVLPSAVPGILAGVILAIGRIVGETAALMYTGGTVADSAVRRDGFRADPRGTYVQPRKRGSVHGSGICDGGGPAGPGGGDQYAVRASLQNA